MKKIFLKSEYEDTIYFVMLDYKTKMIITIAEYNPMTMPLQIHCSKDSSLFPIDNAEKMKQELGLIECTKDEFIEAIRMAANRYINIVNS